MIRRRFFLCGMKNKIKVISLLQYLTSIIGLIFLNKKFILKFLDLKARSYF